MNNQAAITEYTLLRPQYSAFTERIESLITELLKLDEIKTHLIESRTKTVESFKEKIRRPGKSYKEPLKELIDLSGVRIIVYYIDDIEKVSNILSKEFNIVETEKSHLATEYSVDQFGYISLHFVIALKPERARLPEWSTYKDFVTEIQIRTVLQHSWAAVSHALQYKHESDVPKALRRKLHRLAGLFELADEEFSSLRSETVSIQKEASEALEHGDHEILINPITLKEFMQRWDKSEENRNIMKEIGYFFDDDMVEDSDKDYFGEVSLYCEKFGIKTIEDLISIVNFNAESYFNEVFDGGPWYISDGFMLFLLLIRAKIDDFTEKDLVTSGGWSEEIAKRVIKSAKKDKKANITNT